MAARAVDICVCTFKRPALLQRLLVDLRELQTAPAFSLRVIVGDNDRAESARSVVEQIQREGGLTIDYFVEPKENISLVRNLVVRQATADLVAFIDDDEFPTSNWLTSLVQTLDSTNAAGVLGPVLPHYPEDTPEWFRKAALYSFRKRYPTGQLLRWQECRTGNVLLKRAVVASLAGPFREEFGTGGEDQDFFRRATEKGYQFRWCDEAVAYEAIQPSRWQRRAVLSRALLRGKNTFQHPRRRWQNVSKATCAIPLYCILLPFAFLSGQHKVMSLLTRLTSHIGLVLAAVHLNPMKRRVS